MPRDIYYLSDEYNNELSKKLVDKSSIEYYSNNELYLIYSSYEEYMKAYNKKLNKFKGWSFITLSPDHKMRGFDYKDFEALKNWCNNWFSPKIYKEYIWVIESGKHADAPHLHVHFLCQINNSKKHKSNLIKNWNSSFPNNKLIGDDYFLIKCNTQEIVDDKFKYMKNEYKGSHMNFEDLSLLGGQGACGFITSKLINPPE